MNLQPLYNVKERLRASAMAGVGLLDEDFRLKRAVEELEPLTAAGAVFAKLRERLDALLSAPPERRASALLDALALTDAILYTQGKTGIEGDITPLPSQYGKYVPLSYEQIRSLAEALTTKGSGRLEVLRQTFDEHPNYFTDYRILLKVIDALGDRYTEIGDLCVEILSAQGERIVPLLKKGFDPTGGRAMALRVKTIANAADESEWVLSQIPKAKKDVRAELLLSLRKSADNIPRLLEFAKTERGNNRNAVLSALGVQDCNTPQLRAFWEGEIKANGASIPFFKDKSEWASDLVALHLRQRLEHVLEQGAIEDKERSEDLRRWIDQAQGRVSPGMETLWLWVDEHFDGLQSVEDKSKMYEWERLGKIGTELLKRLFFTLCERRELSEFCLRLYRTHRNSPRYVPHGLIASLLTKDAAEVYEEFAPMLLTRKPLLNSEKKREFHNAVLSALRSNIYWSREKKTHYIYIWGSEFRTFIQPLDSRWLDRLLHGLGGNLMYAVWNDGYGVLEQIEILDHLIVTITDPDDARMSETVAEHLRRRMVETGHWLGYCAALLRISKSPRGALKPCFTKQQKPPDRNALWEMLDEASKCLPAAEVIEMIEELLEADWFLPVDEKAVSQGKVKDGVYPFWYERTEICALLKESAKRLEKGEPFPPRREWKADI